MAINPVIAASVKLEVEAALTAIMQRNPPINWTDIDQIVGQIVDSHAGQETVLERMQKQFRQRNDLPT